MRIPSVPAAAVGRISALITPVVPVDVATVKVGAVNGVPVNVGAVNAGAGSVTVSRTPGSVSPIACGALPAGMPGVLTVIAADVPTAGVAGGVGVSVAGTVAAGTVAAVAPAVGVQRDVRVKLVRLTRPLVHVVAERLGLRGLLVRLLAQPCCIHLRLLCISPGPNRLRFAFAGIELPGLGLAADFSGLFPMRVVPLLLHRLAAPPAGQQ